MAKYENPAELDYRNGGDTVDDFAQKYMRTVDYIIKALNDLRTPTGNSAGVEPEPYMWRIADNKLYIRNGDNTDYVLLGEISPNFGFRQSVNDRFLTTADLEGDGAVVTRNEAGKVEGDITGSPGKIAGKTIDVTPTADNDVIAYDAAQQKWVKKTLNDYLKKQGDAGWDEMVDEVADQVIEDITPVIFNFWYLDEYGYLVPLVGSTEGGLPSIHGMVGDYEQITARSVEVAGNINATGNVTAGMLTTPQANVTTLTANAVNADTITADDIIAKGPVVDVRAFGAVGDGVTDDTAAIQAAIDYAAPKRAKVIFPNQNYAIRQIVLRDNGVYQFNNTTIVRLLGVSAIVSENIDEFGTGAYNSRDIDGAQDLLIKLKITGNMHIKRADNFEPASDDIRRTYKGFRHSDGNQIFYFPLNLTGLYDSVIEGISSDYSVSATINLCFSKDTIVKNCNIHGGADNCIQIFICQNCIATENTCIDGGGGLLVLQYCEHCSLVNNICGYKTASVGVNNAIISVKYSHDCLVQGNIIDGYGDTASIGIDVNYQDGSNSRTYVTANMIKNCYCGVSVDGSEYTYINGNTYHNVGSMGAHKFNGSSYIYVNNDIVYDAAYAMTQSYTSDHIFFTNVTCMGVHNGIIIQTVPAGTTSLDFIVKDCLFNVEDVPVVYASGVSSLASYKKYLDNISNSAQFDSIGNAQDEAFRRSNMGISNYSVVFDGMTANVAKTVGAAHRGVYLITVTGTNNDSAVSMFVGGKYSYSLAGETVKLMEAKYSSGSNESYSLSIGSSEITLTCDKTISSKVKVNVYYFI